MAKNLEISLLLDFYGPSLTEKQRDMTEQYYDEDLSLAEIAQNQGITRQGVRDAIKRAEQQMFAMEEQLGMVRRFRRITKEIADIAADAQEIVQVNNGACEQITLLADRILQKATVLAEAGEAN